MIRVAGEPAPMRAQVVIPGRPVAKERPRVTWRTGRAIAYTPPRTRAYERAVGLCALAARPPGWPLDARYAVEIDCYGLRANADLDNVCKAILDSLEGVWFANDKQVARLVLTRVAGKPSVTVTAEVMP